MTALSVDDHGLAARLWTAQQWAERFLVGVSDLAHL